MKKVNIIALFCFLNASTPATFSEQNFLTAKLERASSLVIFESILISAPFWPKNGVQLIFEDGDTPIEVGGIFYIRPLSLTCTNTKQLKKFFDTFLPNGKRTRNAENILMKPYARRGNKISYRCVDYPDIILTFTYRLNEGEDEIVNVID